MVALIAVPILTVSDCKDNKLLKAIHNCFFQLVFNCVTVSDCKDNKLLKAIHNYDYYSNYQHVTVSDCKDNKLLKAIHNQLLDGEVYLLLYQTAKITNF